MFDWSEVQGQPANAVAEQLGGVLEQIDDALGAQPNVPELMLELLGRELEGRPVDAETFDRIMLGLDALLGVGDHPAQLLWWITDVTEREMPLERLEAVANQSAPALERLLRDVFAVYHARLVEAVGRWHQLPENWAFVNRDVYQEIATGEHRIDLTFTKFNGETVQLSCTPPSLLALVTYLLGTLNPLASKTTFAPERVDTFRAEFDALWPELEQARAVAQT